MVYTPPPQTYIQLETDGYLTLDSCKIISNNVNRGIQFNIGGVAQLYLPANASIPGNGVGVLGVDNVGNIFWTAGSGGSGITTLTGDVSAGPGSGSVSAEVTGILNKALPALPGSDKYLNYTGSAWAFTSLPTSLPPSGSASGDLSGSYPGPNVSGILGAALPALPITDGYLNYTGSAWQFSAITYPTTLPPNGPAGGDLAGTYPNPTVASLTGSAGTILIASSGNVITWNKATTAPGLAQSIPTTDVAPANMTISAQSAELAAVTHVTGANLILSAGAPASSAGISGNVVATIFAPTASATTEAAFQVKRGSTVFASIQAIVGAASTDAGLYILPTGTAPTSSNYTIDVSGTTEVVYGDNNTGHMILANQNSSAMILDSHSAVVNTVTTSSGYNFGIQGMATASYGGSVGVIGIPAVTTAPTGNVTGSVLYTTSDGYFSVVPSGNQNPQLKVGSSAILLEQNTYLASGNNLGINTTTVTGTGMVGGLAFAKATTNPTISTTGALIFADSSSGNLSFYPPGVTAATCTLGTNNFNLIGVNILWSSASGNSSIGFTNLATNAGTGANLTISAQNETGTTSTGGNLILNSGSGTTVDGYVQIQAGGTTLYEYGVAGQQITSAAQTMANGANILTAAKYQTGLIVCSGTITGATTLVFPNTIGFWYVDISTMSGISATNTFSVQSGTKSIVALGAALTASTGLVVVSTRGGNTIACIA